MMKDMQRWESSEPPVFWGEIAPCEHVLQIYDNNIAFLNTLTGFVNDGINTKDCSIVIATAFHLRALERRLINDGIDVDYLISEDLYIPIKAEEALDVFMVNDWPDPELFINMVSELFQRGWLKNRRIRAFGEMVALLWAQGNNDATVQLEHLWNRYCSQREITLFCAYPRSGFTDDAEHSLHQICAAHSKVISGYYTGEKDVLYKNANPVAVPTD